LRAIRFCLAEPRLFLTQLRAILRATHYGNVRILVLMLASVSEIDQTLVMIARTKQACTSRACRSIRTSRSAG
jgi:phosphotransferase system enzyme I (PtsI)